MKKKDPDQPLTKRHLLEITNTIKEMGDFIMKELKGFRLEFESFRSEQQHFNKEISQKVKEVSQKVDANTSALTSLDKKVRYQEDMPERLEHVENKTYNLDRRVTALEK